MQQNPVIMKRQTRNFSPQQMFIRMAECHQPKYRFSDSDFSFSEWKAKALPPVLASLGNLPRPVPPDHCLNIEWEDRGIVKRRYEIDVGEFISAAVQINFPSAALSGGRHPALLCWHGHGPFGKDPVMGNAGNHEVQQSILRNNYDYGHQMAEKGYITYALDWMGCGERNDRLKPHFLSTAGERDWCNLYYLHATIFGMTPLGINLSHGRVATDFICSLPEIDPERLGVMGLSGGGTMTLWTALTDDRFKAAEIICYSDLWAEFAIRSINYCGSQVTPAVYSLVDVPDLQGLLAPMPLLVDIGALDQCFPAHNAMKCFEQVKAIYQASDASDRLHLDLFPGDHGWGGNKSEAFFKQYL